MDILDDMGVSKLSAKVNYSFKCCRSVFDNPHAQTVSLSLKWGQVVYFVNMQDFHIYIYSNRAYFHCLN